MDLWRHCLPFSLVTFLAFKLVAPLMMMSFLKKWSTRDKMSLVFKLNVQREFNIFFVCGQRPNDIPSNYLSCCLLDTLLIHIWGVLLGYTSGLNLAVNSLSQLLYNTILLPFQHTFHKFGKYLFLCVKPRCRHF